MGCKVQIWRIWAEGQEALWKTSLDGVTQEIQKRLSETQCMSATALASSLGMSRKTVERRLKLGLRMEWRVLPWVPHFLSEDYRKHTR